LNSFTEEAWTTAIQRSSQLQEEASANIEEDQTLGGNSQLTEEFAQEREDLGASYSFSQQWGTVNDGTYDTTEMGVENVDQAKAAPENDCKNHYHAWAVNISDSSVKVLNLLTYSFLQMLGSIKNKISIPLKVSGMKPRTMGILGMTRVPRTSGAVKKKRRKQRQRHRPTMTPRISGTGMTKVPELPLLNKTTTTAGPLKLPPKSLKVRTTMRLGTRPRKEGRTRTRSLKILFRWPRALPRVKMRRHSSPTCGPQGSRV
jgi:hypothetical protein